MEGFDQKKLRIFLRVLPLKISINWPLEKVKGLLTKNGSKGIPERQPSDGEGVQSLRKRTRQPLPPLIPTLVEIDYYESKISNSN